MSKSRATHTHTHTHNRDYPTVNSHRGATGATFRAQLQRRKSSNAVRNEKVRKESWSGFQICAVTENAEITDNGGSRQEKY